MFHRTLHSPFRNGKLFYYQIKSAVTNGPRYSLFIVAQYHLIFLVFFSRFNQPNLFIRNRIFQTIHSHTYSKRQTTPFDAYFGFAVYWMCSNFGAIWFYVTNSMWKCDFSKVFFSRTIYFEQNERLIAYHQVVMWTTSERAVCVFVMEIMRRRRRKKKGKSELITH